MTAADTALVLVSPPEALAARPRLFAALAQAFPVRFAPADIRDTVRAAAVIVVGAPGGGAPSAPWARGLPTLAFAGERASVTRRAPFTLRDMMGVDRRVRGITLHDRIVAPPPVGTADVLATRAGNAVWTRTRGLAPVHRIASPLAELAPAEVLYGLLGRCQLTAVALIQFLRDVSRGRAPQPPGLRAAFVFDDPNLHGRRYGHIDYATLVRHADDHGYHAAMAMIPLDAGLTHRTARTLFRDRADRVSLLVHGNDHTRGELLGAREDAAALAIAAQALRRIRRFERRCGVRVDPVMAPPHGLCSPAMTRALGAVGFDALTAIHPRPWTEARPSEPPLAGWRPVDFVGGCAVVPRVPLSSSTADLALRAFLNHPLIIYGHHEDVAGGLDKLAEVAATVNGLGYVRWMSVGDIVTSNAAVAVTGGHMRVRPFSRRVRMPIGSEITTLTVESPEDAIDGRILEGVSAGMPSGGQRCAAFGATVPAPDAGLLEIRLHGRTDVDPDAVAAPAWAPWPKLRRVVTEVRDRTAAHAPAMSRARAAAGRAQ